MKVLGVALLALSLNAVAAQVDVFSPQGQAKNVRQVAVRFSQPMVAFGDLRLADPFEVSCEGDPARLKGRGRWADPRNWVYDFEQDLPSGQRCSFALKAGLKSMAGEPLEGTREFRFHTGGPAVLTSLPRAGGEIDGEQWFLLGFDGPLDRASLEKGAWCEAAGVQERIPLRLLDDAQKRQLMEANRAGTHFFYSVYVKGQRVPFAKFKVEDKRWQELPVVAVRCAQRLPAQARVDVVIGPEVRGASGVPRALEQRLVFSVRPPFTVKFSCERVNAQSACLPVSPMRLEFNAPVAREKAAGVRLKLNGGAAFEPVLEPNVKTVQSLEFAAPFPELRRYTVELPGGFADDAGREPENRAAFPLAVGTDENPPLAKFPGRFGVLELNAEPLLPVTVRAVESPRIPGRSVRLADERSIVQRYRRFISAEHERYPLREGEASALDARDAAASFELPRAGGDKPMEVIGIPLPKPGFYLVELVSPRLGAALHGEAKPYYVNTAVLVTNLAVHLKLGRERSIVWVTTLDGGKPVAGARVSVRDCAGRVHFEGDTDARGIADAGERLPAAAAIPGCGGGERALYAFARLGEDLSFTSSEWQRGIAPWNFNVPTAGYRLRQLLVHTVFDRTLFRAGETVSMKHVARLPTMRGFDLPQAPALPAAAELVHTGSGQKYRIETRFDEKGVAESAWKIPAEARLGEYQVQWVGRGQATSSGGAFRVEAYRVPLMRAALAAPAAPQVRPAATKVDAAVSYLAGGPAAFLPVKVRHRVEPRGVSFRDYADFHFGGEPVKEGLQQGDVIDYWSTFDPDESGAEPQGAAGPVATRTLTLDGAGTAAIDIDKLPPVERPASLLVEMEYADPNGEVLATSTRVPLHPAGIYVGIRPEGWAANRGAVKVQVVAVDTAGKPLAGRAVSIEPYLRNTYSYRRRLIGGFYAYDSSTETKRAGAGCSARTDERGLAFCTLKPDATGELILVARAKDDAGNESLATASVWVLGDSEWWFDQANHDRIDLVPEKKRYEPGETARLQVRMPFREATVLVTVEREGVLDQQVVQLKGDAPVIEVPIAGHYGPNVYVSALAVRGRIDPEYPGPYAWLKSWFYRVAKFFGIVDEVPAERDTRPTALVDLSRPAYKLGLTEIKVGRRDYELQVKVTPERDVLRPRERVKLLIEVKDAAGRPAANGEIALAAVDEGLLELKDNLSWDILEAMLGRRPEEVSTATAQGQVIGKRHFGRKALPPGGGGGRAGARELFDTLVAWQGRVALDAQGRATLEIAMNDSLSEFRIVAVALEGSGRFGHGVARVRTTQDLMLFSGLPPLVREGDEFAAMFTARNTTARPLEVDLVWKVNQNAGKERVALKPGEARVVSIPLRVPLDASALQWELEAKSADAIDRLKVSQRVIAVHPVRVYQATLAQLDQPLSFPVERPGDAVPGKGGVRVELLRSLAGELGPVREYFERYPYTCFEQRVSKAIGLQSEAQWNAVAAALPAHLDRDGLVRYFAVDWIQGSDALTAYVVQIADAAGYQWPQESLERMLGGLEGFVAGRVVRGSALPTADLTLRKLAAIEALSRHRRARAQMLDSITIDPALWPTSALVDWIGVLQRVNVPEGRAKLREALSQLRARLNFQGTAMTFSTERGDALWWLMVSGDVNANRALLAVLHDAEWREDIGRMVRGDLSRQRRGTWGTTVANAWGTVAIARFSEAFEKVPAAGNVEARLGGTAVSMPVGAQKERRDIEWPAGRETLVVEHAGRGAPWAIVQSRAAIPLKAALSSGYAITRTVSPVERKDSSGWTRGDVYRVTLEIDAQTDMTWVVVDDPIPAGAAILGSGLGRDASTLTAGEKRAGWAWPAFVERTHEAYRAYYEFVPKGRFKLEYTVRLNNPGRFELPATRVEAMYSPEMFGELPNAGMQVKP